MRTTILDTPIVTPILRAICRGLFKAAGWKVDQVKPDAKKYVMIAAPHTSNWDGILLLMFAGDLHVKIFWLGKHTLFQFPFGPIFRWFGGIPVDRRKSNNLVSQVVEVFDANEEVIVVVPPEGTRAKSDRWKTGFYHIARQAKVPIALGFLDYGIKYGGIGPLFEPSGDIETDLPHIRSFYDGKTGKNHQDFGDISVKAEDADRSTSSD